MQHSHFVNICQKKKNACILLLPRQFPVLDELTRLGDVSYLYKTMERHGAITRLLLMLFEIAQECHCDKDALFCSRKYNNLLYYNVFMSCIVRNI